MKFFSFKFILLIVILFGIAIINAHYEIFALNIPKGEVMEKAEGAFRVMTWNVNASLETEDVEYVRTGLISEIEKQDPDILCLQELSPKIFKEMLNN